MSKQGCQINLNPPCHWCFMWEQDGGSLAERITLFTICDDWGCIGWPWWKSWGLLQWCDSFNGHLMCGGKIGLKVFHLCVFVCSLWGCAVVWLCSKIMRALLRAWPMAPLLASTIGVGTMGPFISWCECMSPCWTIALHNDCLPLANNASQWPEDKGFVLLLTVSLGGKQLHRDGLC